jgi:hypothetical protein
MPYRCLAAGGRSTVLSLGYESVILYFYEVVANEELEGTDYISSNPSILRIS